MKKEKKSTESKEYPHTPLVTLSYKSLGAGDLGRASKVALDLPPAKRSGHKRLACAWAKLAKSQLVKIENGSPKNTLSHSSDWSLKGELLVWPIQKIKQQTKTKKAPKYNNRSKLRHARHVAIEMNVLSDDASKGTEKPPHEARNASHTEWSHMCWLRSWNYGWFKTPSWTVFYGVQKKKKIGKKMTGL